MSAISIVLPSLHGGGAERLHVNLAHDWIARGHSVEFVLMRAEGELLPLLSPQIRVVDLAASRIRQVIPGLLRHLRRARPDLVLSAMWPLTSVSILAWLLAGRRGRMFVSDHNQLSISSVQELGVSPHVLRAVMAATYPFASGIIAVSRGVREDVCRISGLDPARIQVIYNPVATGIAATRETEATRERLWGADAKACVLAAGTLKRQKDHETLIRAFARLPRSLGANLIILGEGDLRPSLEGLIAQLGLADCVSLPGFVREPRPWFQSADLFVLSSRWEGFGNVIVEALECGVPVVSTDCPSGPSEILEGGRYGTLVPVGDPAAMAHAIEAGVRAPPARAPLTERARAFSISSISTQYLDYFSHGTR